MTAPISTAVLPAPARLGRATSTVASSGFSWGMLYVLSIPLMGGLAVFTRDATVGGFQFSGWMWAVYIPVGAMILLGRMALYGKTDIEFPVARWMPWVVLLFLSLVWCEGATYHNVQDAVQLAMPIFIGVLSSAFVRTRRDLGLLTGAFLCMVVILLFNEAVRQIGLIGSLDEPSRTAALGATLCGIISFAMFPRRKVLALVGWSLAILVTFLSGSRMATAGLLVVPAFHPLVRPFWIRPAIVGALVIVGLSIFYSSTFQERFFRSGSGSLSDVYQGDLDDMGRFEAWQAIMAKSQERPILGFGVGSSYDFVPTVWPEARHVHNEYIRLIFEFGRLGALIFFCVVARELWVIRRNIGKTDGHVREAFAGALLGLLALLFTALTDNTLGYNLSYTNPLFALLGAAYGVAARQPMFGWGGHE